MKQITCKPRWRILSMLLRYNCSNFNIYHFNHMWLIRDEGNNLLKLPCLSISMEWLYYSTIFLERITYWMRILFQIFFLVYSTHRKCSDVIKIHMRWCAYFFFFINYSYITNVILSILCTIIHHYTSINIAIYKWNV